jgi:hypothetical protein
MGYERDSDRATRGAGAIAALDRASGPRFQHRREGAQATVRRDRAMLAIAQGALGRIDLRVNPADRKIPGAGRLTPTSTVMRETVPPAPTAPTLPPFMVPVRAPVTGNVLAPVRLTTAKPIINTGITPPIIAPLPTTTSLPATSGAATVKTVSGGAGSAPAAKAPIVLTPGPVLSVPDPGEATDTGMRTALMVGGAALAAYFLFRGQRGAP